LNEEKKQVMLEKWGVDLYLPDPKHPIPDDEESTLYPTPDLPIVEYGVFSGSSGKDQIYIWPPGTTIMDRKGRERPVNWGIPGPLPKEVRRIKNWEIWNGKTGKYEELTRKDCPKSISISIEIRPWFSKMAIEGQLLEVFETAYQKVRDAQKAVLGKKQRRPGDDEFQKCMKVYDLKEESPKMSWADIAEEVIVGCTYENPNKRGKKKVLVYQWAIDKVRDYYKVADNLINKEGWRQL